MNDIKTLINNVVSLHDEYCKELEEEDKPGLEEILNFIWFYKNFSPNDINPEKLLKTLWCYNDFRLEEKLRKILMNFTKKKSEEYYNKEYLKKSSINKEIPKSSDEKTREKESKTIEKYFPSPSNTKKSAKKYCLIPPRLTSERKLGKAWKSIKRSYKAKNTSEIDIQKVIEFKSINNFWECKYKKTRISKISIMILIDKSPTMTPYNRKISEIVNSLTFYSGIRTKKYNFSPEEINYKKWERYILQSELNLDKHLTFLFTDGVSFAWMEKEAENFFKEIGTNKKTKLFWLSPHPEWLLATNVLGFLSKKEKNLIGNFGIIPYDDIKTKEMKTNFSYKPIDEEAKERITIYREKAQTIENFEDIVNIKHSTEAFEILAMASILNVFDADIIHLLRINFIPKAKLHHESEFYCSGFITQEKNCFKVKKEFIEKIYNIPAFKKKFNKEKIIEINEFISKYIEKNKSKNDEVWKTQFAICETINAKDGIDSISLIDTPQLELLKNMEIIVPEIIEENLALEFHGIKLPKGFHWENEKYIICLTH